MTRAARARRNTIADALGRAAANFGERPALGFGEASWSFRALHDAAGRIGNHLLGLGLRKGDRVAAYGRNSDGYFLLWLACVRAGLVHVPVNYALSGEELTYIVGQSGAVAMVSDATLAANLAPVREMGTVRHFLDFAALPALGRDPALDPALDAALAEGDLAQLLYTSGTTALPKGAAMSHAALLAEYTSCILALELTAADRSIAALPLYHSAQMHCFLMPSLLVGGYSLLLAAPVADQVLELIERHRMTTFFAPPTVWISLLRHADFDRRDLSSLASVFYGASIMPVPVLEELRRRLPGARPFNCYGQSEIGPLATVLKPEDHDARPGSVGRPIFNVETRVVDPDMRDCPPGVQGEVVHRSPQLLDGYWDKPEATAEAFAGGWFHSGDVGTLDEDGFLYIVDRIKDVINTGGVLVASRDVEEALFTHPAVSEVAVIALPDPKWIEAITAVVVLRQGATVSEEALIAHARQSLAPFKLPKRVIFADDLPRNTAGKLLKRELRRLHGGAAPWQAGGGALA